ncbi:MAG: hypothetical protein KAU50_11420 [Candidatus Marinimicrobia bacterium]|nr:hypothetical protein [Candidatus Neomarinimicrobiota bacterium]
MEKTILEDYFIDEDTKLWVHVVIIEKDGWRIVYIDGKQKYLTHANKDTMRTPVKFVQVPSKKIETFSERKQ